MVRREATEKQIPERGGSTVVRCACPTGWGQYFRTGNASRQFNAVDSYVVRRLRSLRIKRKGRHLRPGEAPRWNREYFETIGLHRLRGTIRYPAQPSAVRESA